MFSRAGTKVTVMAVEGPGWPARLPEPHSSSGQARLPGACGEPGDTVRGRGDTQVHVPLLGSALLWGSARIGAWVEGEAEEGQPRPRPQSRGRRLDQKASWKGDREGED